MAGQRDGRVSERVRPNYTPAHLKDFDAEKEWYRLHELVESAEARAEGPEVTEELRKQALGKEHAAKGLSGQALENQIRKNRVRWLKNYLTEEAHAAGEGAGLAEYLYVHEEPGGIADRETWRGAADCDCASGDCRDFGGEAVSRME